MRASASTKPPTTAATSFPSTPCNCQIRQMLFRTSLNWSKLQIITHCHHRLHTAPATRVSTSSQVVGTNCPDSFFTIGWVSLCLLSPSYANLSGWKQVQQWCKHHTGIYVCEVKFCVIRKEPGFIWDPLLIDILIKTRQDSHHLTPTRGHHDVTTHSIQDINGFSLPVEKNKENTSE